MQNGVTQEDASSGIAIKTIDGATLRLQIFRLQQKKFRIFTAVSLVTHSYAMSINTLHYSDPCDIILPRIMFTNLHA